VSTAGYKTRLKYPGISIRFDTFMYGVKYVMFHKFRTIIFFSQESPAHETFEVDPSFSEVINNCPPLFRTNKRTSDLEPHARVLYMSATHSIAALSIISSNGHPG